MATELIMRDELGGIFNSFANVSATSRGLSVSAAVEPNIPSRLAAMRVLANPAAAARRLSMNSALKFIRGQKGKPIPRSSNGVPGAVRKGGVRPMMARRGNVTTADARRRRGMANAARAAIRKSRGTPEQRARKAVVMLVYLFTGKGARQLNDNGKKVVRSIMNVASSRAKQNQFPALTMKEIEGLFKVSTS